MFDIQRVVIWFSAGATSGIAAEIAEKTYRNSYPCHLVLCDTGSEDDDNMRYAKDISRHINLPLEVIHNPKYIDTFDVYDKTGFLVGPHGARCTLELKKVPRRLYEDLSKDLQVFGFDASELNRAHEFIYNNPEVHTWFPLIERGIIKSDARQMLMQAGIKEPRTYSEGFKNANCLKRGCVKGGMGYWNHMRRVRPEVFLNMAKKEREIGHSVCSKEILSKNGEKTKVPVYLDELDPHVGNYDSEPSFQCGLFCGIQ
jgi:hypothetical protein